MKSSANQCFQFRNSGTKHLVHSETSTLCRIVTLALGFCGRRGVRAPFKASQTAEFVIFITGSRDKFGEYKRGNRIVGSLLRRIAKPIITQNTAPRRKNNESHDR